MAVDAAFLPCGAIELDPELHVLSANSYVYDLLGYEADELLNVRFDKLLTVPGRVYMQTHVYPLVALRGLASELYLTLQTRHKTPIPVLLNAAKQERDGQVRFYLSFMPVFQRRQYEQELLKARKTAENELLRNEMLLQVQQELEQNKINLDRQVGQLRQRNSELEQFGKIISHDLQEPLRKITTFADMLRAEASDSVTDTGHIALSSLDRASKRLRALVSELQLYFTQTIEPPNVTDVPVGDVIESIMAEYDNANVTLQLSSLPTVLGNAAELRSLFQHLLDNAVKFRQSGQPLIVSISGKVVGHNQFRSLPNKYNYVNYARIVVSDNGIGFDNQHRETIFQLLKKLHPNTPGIGLGLAMARKIAERHYGLISAESVPGQGTKITVLLPVA